jgi:hypothetical protein
LSNKVKLIVDKSDGTQDIAQIIKSVVKREGKRSVDHATITVSAKHDIEENDTVSYMQDEVDTTFLTGIWNFQGSCKDESGNNLNGTGNADYRYPNTGTNIRKFGANYALQFDAAGEEITISDNTELDFTKQFDINIAFTMESSNPSSHFNGSSNTTQMLFSKHDGTNGVEIGIKYLGAPNFRWVIYAKLDSTTFTGDASLPVDFGGIYHTTARFIRFYRDDDNKVKLLLDNVTDGTNCVQTVAVNSTRTTANLYFGTDRTQAMDFDGILHQVRIYTGGYLSEGDSHKLISVAPQPMTLKFIGKVEKIRDSFDNKILLCKGLTKFILNTKLSSVLIGGSTSSASTNEPATHQKNIFDEGQYITDVLQTILYHSDPNFTWLRAFSDGQRSDLDGKYTATGSFLTTLDMLSVMDSKHFFTLPTKILVYEKDDGIPTGKVASGTKNYTFEHNNFIITERGKNSVKVKNDFEFVGRLQLQYKEQTLNSGNAISNGTVITLDHIADNLILVNGSGTVLTDYKIDMDSKKITFTHGSNPDPSGVIAKYHYEKVTGATDDVLYYTTNKTSSITASGRNSKRFFIPQLTHRADFKSYGGKIKNILAETTNRYRVEVPYLLNSLRENHIITLSNPVMKFDGADTTDQLVKSIEWRFPEAVTIIDCGEHDLDMFEYGSSLGTDVSTLSETTTLTKNESNSS